MNKNLRLILLWTPRIAGIMSILLQSLCIRTIISMEYSFWTSLLVLFMCLTPSITLTIALVLAWKWEWIGALAFLGWSARHLNTAHGFHRSMYDVITIGIPAVVGLLFLAGWLWRGKIRPVMVETRP